MKSIRMKMLSSLLGVLLVLVLFSTSAAADPTGFVEWNGAAFTIEHTSTSGDDYGFLLTADFTGFTGGGHTDYIVGINFKPASGNLTNVVPPVLTTGVTDPGAWNYGVDINLSGSNTSCNAVPGNNDFFCGATPNLTANPTDTVYTWAYTLTIENANPTNLVLDTGLRALFTCGTEENCSGSGIHYSLMSEKTSVPEPSSLLLFGLGLLGVGGIKARHASQG